MQWSFLYFVNTCVYGWGLLLSNLGSGEGVGEGEYLLTQDPPVNPFGYRVDMRRLRTDLQ